MASTFTLVTDDRESSAGAPPAAPSLTPRRWLAENLFSSPVNTVLTLVFAALGLVMLRGLANFVFSEERTWDGVRVNLRLLFTHAYPEEQYIRIWVSLGVILVMAGLALGLVGRFEGLPLRRISMWLTGAAALIALTVVLREPSVHKGADGTPLRDSSGDLIRESFLEAMADRGVYWLVVVILAAGGAALWFCFDDERRRHLRVATVPFAFAVLGLLVLSAWVYPWGHYAFSEGTYIYEPGRTVANTTKVPWTVMWLLLVAAWATGRGLSDNRWAPRLRVTLNLSWLLVPFVLYWVVLRDPDLDWAHIWSTDLPMALAFAVGGAAVLWFLTQPTLGEAGAAVAGGLLALAAFHWVAAFFGWYPMLQKARLSFLLLALAALLAPNFKGVAAQRAKLVVGWVAAMGVFHYLATMINSASTIETPTANFIGGFSITVVVAVFTLLFSFPLGVLLALARTSRMPLFRVLATSYIETLRGIPLITILMFFSIMVPLFLPQGMELGEMAAIITGFTLFSAAYLAENIRGGLQSIRRGQYEASDAVGLSTAQRTAFVVLPQALRVSIPPLVGQLIATFKETSLIAIVGGFDFLRIANAVISSQSEFLGVKREGLLFVSLIYWVFAFSMSQASRRLERRVGLGER